MKKIAILIAVVLSVSSAFAEMSFSGPDINAGNEALFSVVTGVPGNGQYRTLIRKNVDSLKTEQLTFYPESMETLSNGAVLQLRNRFGTGRFDTRTDTFSWIEDIKPFQSGGQLSPGLLEDVSASPDGRWLVSIDPVSASRGKLVIYDVEKGMRFVLSESVERGPIPVAWAPDASVMLYSLDHVLYFARPESFFSVSSINQKYRVLGRGTVRNVSWYSATRFLYVTGTTVYRVQSSELFARSLYTPLMGPGELAGKIPCDFDDSLDSVCASPDGSSVLLAKNGRNVYFCPLEGDDYVSATRPALLPYLLLPGNTAALSFVWTDDDNPVILSESVEDGKKTMKAWKMADVAQGRVFVPVQIPSGISSFSLSPDGSLMAFNASQGVRLYSTSSWKETAVWKDEPVVAIAWGDSSTLFVGGRETVRKWNVKTGVSSVLLLSAVTAYAWDETGKTVLGDTASLGRFAWAGGMKWTPLASGKTRPASATNSSWRLYLDSGKGYFSNMLYARAATNPGGTRALVSESDAPKAVPADKRGTAESPDIFSHGSRTGLRQVALTFDAMENLDGLPSVLHVLARYGIRATFFINGEFIREHPGAVNEIAKAGHQCASLFFTTWDLSGTTYRIDEDFIARGLSRNEDDFYNATGQELTLLWHAPHYVTSPLILSAGQKAGYRYVSGDVTVLDWVSADQARAMPGLYKSSATIIDDIMAAVKPGSIIPVRIGKAEGRRDDYLYDRVSLLVNALTEAGYEIVTVDTLINNVRK